MEQRVLERELDMKKLSNEKEQLLREKESLQSELQQKILSMEEVSIL